MIPGRLICISEIAGHHHPQGRKSQDLSGIEIYTGDGQVQIHQRSLGKATPGDRSGISQGKEHRVPDLQWLKRGERLHEDCGPLPPCAERVSPICVDHAALPAAMRRRGPAGKQSDYVEAERPGKSPGRESAGRSIRTADARMSSTPTGISSYWRLEPIVQDPVRNSRKPRLIITGRLPRMLRPTIIWQHPLGDGHDHKALR